MNNSGPTYWSDAKIIKNIFSYNTYIYIIHIYIYAILSRSEFTKTSVIILTGEALFVIILE